MVIQIQVLEQTGPVQFLIPHSLAGEGGQGLYGASTSTSAHGEHRPLEEQAEDASKALSSTA